MKVSITSHRREERAVRGLVSHPDINNPVLYFSDFFFFLYLHSQHSDWVYRMQRRQDSKNRASLLSQANSQKRRGHPPLPEPQVTSETVPDSHPAEASLPPSV